LCHNSFDWSIDVEFGVCVSIGLIYTNVKCDVCVTIGSIYTDVECRCNDIEMYRDMCHNSQLVRNMFQNVSQLI